MKIFQHPETNQQRPREKIDHTEARRIRRDEKNAEARGGRLLGTEVLLPFKGKAGRGREFRRRTTGRGEDEEEEKEEEEEEECP